MSARCLQALAGALWGLVLLISVQVGGGPACARTTPSQAPPPPHVQALLRLFDDPAIRAWIDQHRRSALSSLGVEIAPPIAGAGIFGVAVGLLRRHRGPIFTVPYGQLGAVENRSRDWVIDKMTMNLTCDTDLDKAKKVVKQVRKVLAADPEFARHIIEPRKMQGVEQFGDFAIQLRTKMMTRPDEQFVIRRKACAMLEKAFDESGIKFAFPTVQMAAAVRPNRRPPDRSSPSSKARRPTRAARRATRLGSKCREEVSRGPSRRMEAG